MMKKIMFAIVILVLLLLYLIYSLLPHKSIKRETESSTESKAEDVLSGHILDMEGILMTNLNLSADSGLSCANTVLSVMETAAFADEAISDINMKGTAGDILTMAQVSGNEAAFFQAYEIHTGDEIYNRINGKSYRDNPDISLSNLRYLRLLHYNFDHEIQIGEMIVNASICEQTLQIFRELFSMEYEIESIYLIDNYWTGDGENTDETSMEANNTSCFNYRQVVGSGSLSKHALGRAIDLNPRYNPYIRTKDGAALIQPYNATDEDVNRSGRAHQIMAGDDCYNVFVSHGFSWGGSWHNPVDYQHFQCVN